MTETERYFMCHACAHSIPVGPGFIGAVECDRCGYVNRKLRPKSARLTLSFALTALIFYVPANLFPFMSIELYGNRNSSTIWSGILSLFEDGSWFIAAVVFVASMVVPFLKLAALFYLSLTARRGTAPKFKTRLYYAIEAIGRWSMLDIFLLAVLVAIMKLGPWTTVEPEIGSLMFALVVIFTMLSSAYFDPRLLWERENEN